MVTGGSFAGNKKRPVRKAEHFHLVPRLRIVEPYLHSLTRKEGEEELEGEEKGIERIRIEEEGES
jgi:hypothetical protein